MDSLQQMFEQFAIQMSKDHNAQEIVFKAKITHNTRLTDSLTATADAGTYATQLEHNGHRIKELERLLKEVGAG